MAFSRLIRDNVFNEILFQFELFVCDSQSFENHVIKCVNFSLSECTMYLKMESTIASKNVV